LIFSAVILTVMNHRAGRNVLVAPEPVPQAVLITPPPAPPPLALNDISGVRIMPTQTQTSPILTGKSISPVSPKISDSDVVPESESPMAGPSSEYLTFWHALDIRATQEFVKKNKKIGANDIQQFRADFIASLGYWYDSRTQQVYSAPQSKIEISVTTLTCYLNGYVPEKPYIKPSCPSN
jgi:hypothetical protein